jgi:SAM-dependent methyltransferase
MKLLDRLHCPACQGRLVAESAGVLRCTHCERAIPVVDGIADFAVGRDDVRLHGRQFWGRADTAGLFIQIQAAAGGRWPAFLGDTMALGCGQGDVAEAIVVSRTTRSVLLLDTAMDRLQACRIRLTPRDPEQAVAYASVGDFQTSIRDSVADTIICTGLLSGIADVRAFLAMVHRVLKPGGRAAFVVPNRRYWEAMCSAMAEALIQLHAKERVWPEGQAVALEILSHTRRLLLHREDLGYLAVLKEKHLFDSDALEDLGREVGFATAEAVPLDPDPAGVATTRRICREAGAADSFTDSFGAMVSAVGRPFFDLLGRQEGSASMLLWLTKASGPYVRIFSARPAQPPMGFAGPDATLGGVPPRWSVELLARDTQDGIVVTLGGWCLCNVAVQWVRLTLGGVTRNAPVWRPRPDVHEVLNGRGLFYPLNALCSGLEGELLFADVHATDNACPFRLEVVLASGVAVTGATPETLVMDEQMVVAH